MAYLEAQTAAGEPLDRVSAAANQRSGTAKCLGIKEDIIRLTALQRVAALATILATSTATGALSQATTDDPNTTEMEAMKTVLSESAGRATDQARGEQLDQSGMMSGPMDQGTMCSGMMSQGGMCSGMMEQGAMCSDMCAGMTDQSGMDRGGMDHGATNGGAMDQGRAAPGMMDHGRMGTRTTSSMMHPGIMGAEMHGHIMKMVFALADADANGGLSLDELATIQSRIFAAVDADDDGNVTPEEVQAFIRE